MEEELPTNLLYGSNRTNLLEPLYRAPSSSPLPPKWVEGDRDHVGGGGDHATSSKVVHSPAVGLSSEATLGEGEEGQVGDMDS